MAHAAGVAFWAALAIGVVFRVIRYVDNRSLWLDESFMALNLLDKSARGLLESLDYTQSAPPAFLLVEKGVLELLGDSERSLRLFPLLSSLVALGVFAWLVRRLLSGWGAAVALAIFATNDYLVYQASELKPYSSDVTVAVILLALYVWFEEGAPTLRRALPLLVVGVAAPLLSFPAALVLAGVGCGVLVRLWKEGTRRDLLAGGAVMGAWVAAFGLVVIVTSDTVQQISTQVFRGESSAGESAAKVAELTWSVFVDPGNFGNGTNALAALLAVFGFFAFVRSGPLWRPVALTVPPLLAVVAALLDKYPIGGRFSLFLVPFVVLFVVRGLEALVGDSRRSLLLGSALIVVLVGPLLVEGVGNAKSPPREEDVRPLIETAAARWHDGDVLYVFRNSQYALRYYTECSDCRPDGVEWPWPARFAPPPRFAGEFTPALESVPPTVVIGTQAEDIDRVDADLARLPEKGRLWMLFSHVPPWEPLNHETLMRRELDRRGRIVAEWAAGTADLVLYDLG